MPWRRPPSPSRCWPTRTPSPCSSWRSASRPGSRGGQGEQGPVHIGVCLPHEQAVLRGRRGRGASRPVLPARRMGGEVGRPRHAGIGGGVQHVHPGQPDGRPRPARRPGEIHVGDLARIRARRQRTLDVGPGRLGPRALRRGDRGLRDGPIVVVEVGRRPEFLRRGPLALELGPPWQGERQDADSEVQQAVAKLNTSLKARKDANAPDTDPGLVTNACDLAIIQLETGKPADALALLDPFAKTLGEVSKRPASMNNAYSRVLSYILRGHVATGKVDLAIADMKKIEGIGGAGNSAASLYLELGRLLEREIETLKKKNDRAGLAKVEESYQKFLKALVATKTGQTFQSLRWAADKPAQARLGQGGERGLLDLDQLLWQGPQLPQERGGLRAGHARTPQAGRLAPDDGRPGRGRDPAQRESSTRTSGRSSPRWRRGSSSTPRRRPSKGPG